MRKLTAYLLALIISIISTGNAFSAPTLLVVGDPLAPFEYDKDGKPSGLDVDIATRIFNQLGIKFEIRLVPWKRAWQMIEDGAADAVFTTSRKPAREPFLYYPKEDMWVSEYTFFVKKGNKISPYLGYESAKEKTIGVIKGYSYHDSFWAANLKLEEVISLENNFKKLLADRVDMVITDKIVGQFTLKEMGLQSQVEFYEQPVFAKGYPMPFARNSKYPNIEQVAKDFEQKLIEMKANGEYEKIVERWVK